MQVVTTFQLRSCLRHSGNMRSGNSSSTSTLTPPLLLVQRNYTAWLEILVLIQYRVIRRTVPALSARARRAPISLYHAVISQSASAAMVASSNAQSAVQWFAARFVPILYRLMLTCYGNETFSIELPIIICSRNTLQIVIISLIRLNYYYWNV